METKGLPCFLNLVSLLETVGIEEVNAKMKKKKFKIVILDDDKYFNMVLSAYVKTICNPAIYNDYEFVITSYKRASEWWDSLDTTTNVMFLDKCLLDPKDEITVDGKEVLKLMKSSCPNCKVIMVTAHGSTDEAAELMKQGVYDYVDKAGNTNEKLGTILHKILKEDQLKEGFL